MVTATAAAGWVPDLRTFGARLALVRQRMGWNVKEAAVACGVAPQSWRQWEWERSRPRDLEGIARVISERTGVSVVWLALGPDVDSPTGQSGTAMYRNAATGQSSQLVMPFLDEDTPADLHRLAEARSSVRQAGRDRAA